MRITVKTLVECGTESVCYVAFVFCALAVTVLTFPAAAQVTFLANFNPKPRAALNDLTEEQSDLYWAAMRLAGDGEESLVFQACEDLMNDPALPNDVYRWAYLHQIMIYAVTSREDLAMHVANQWISKNPDDPVNLNVRCVMVQICAWRGSPRFKPTLRDLQAAAEPIFTLYSPTNVDVIDAHSVYVDGLERFYAKTHDVTLLERARDHILEALSILDRCEETPALKEDARLDASYAQRKREELDYKLNSLEASLGSVAASTHTKGERVLDAAVDKGGQSPFISKAELGKHGKQVRK